MDVWLLDVIVATNFLCLDLDLFARFDECGISPLTIKALSSAGYIRMTRVQEATLSACLECRLPIVAI